MKRVNINKNNIPILIVTGVLIFIAICIVLLSHFTLPQKGNIQNQNDILVLVNKQYYLSSNYVPDDLTVPKVKCVKEIGADEKKIRKVAAKALEDMFNAATKEGIQLYRESGYRSFASQKKIYERTKKENGEEYANKYCAIPGHSEHQTGLCMDITNIDFIDDANDKVLGEKKEGIWLKNNAHHYGFILRYPDGRNDITGYNYEPWHFRYVGIKEATEVFNKGIVLEEYLGKNDFKNEKAGE